MVDDGPHVVGVDGKTNLAGKTPYLWAELRRRGLLFVGLDVIGEYLTEVNVTSPTCIRELDAIYGLDIGGQIMDAVHRRLEEAGSPDQA